MREADSRSLPRLAALLPLAAAGIAAALFWQSRIGSVTFLLAIVLGIVVTMIALIDYAHEIIPDRLSYTLLALGVLANGIVIDQGFGFEWEYLAGALLGGGGLWLVRTGYFVLRGVEGLGLGDVKLAAACGAWVGVQGLPAVFLLAAVAGLVWVVATSHQVGISLRSTDRVPFGAFLAPALWAVWMTMA
jgi:leader peptidase (prepilin peptidase) / N-methyltransferase